VSRAHKRRPPTSTSKDAAAPSKPLSLEYIADRLDVDDPIKGAVVRSEEKGMMQGFITYTKFTNWQYNMRWDSLHEDAFACDPDELRELTNRGVRKVDDGTLASELSSQVHMGNCYGEGIVWPHIAEISLLGALGCGRYVVELALEMLEAPDSEYTHVVLQATDNSVGFYESMGFIRVGAISRPNDPEPGDLYIPKKVKGPAPPGLLLGSPQFKVHPEEQELYDLAEKSKRTNNYKGKSGWMLYLDQERPKLKELHPEMGMLETGKVIGAQWKELSEEEKRPFLELAVERKAESLDGMEEQPKKKAKKDKDPNAPRAPKTGWNFYLEEQRRVLIEEKPASERIKPNDLSKVAGGQWKGMAEEEKRPYMELAQADKEHIATQVEKYQASKSAPTSAAPSPYITSATASSAAPSDNEEVVVEEEEEPKAKRMKIEETSDAVKLEAPFATTGEGDGAETVAAAAMSSEVKGETPEPMDVEPVEPAEPVEQEGDKDPAKEEPVVEAETTYPMEPTEEKAPEEDTPKEEAKEEEKTTSMAEAWAEEGTSALEPDELADLPPAKLPSESFDQGYLAPGMSPPPAAKTQTPPPKTSAAAFVPSFGGGSTAPAPKTSAAAFVPSFGGGSTAEPEAGGGYLGPGMCAPPATTAAAFVPSFGGGSTAAPAPSVEEFECEKGCGFEHTDIAVVEAHEKTCKFVMGPKDLTNYAEVNWTGQPRLSVGNEWKPTPEGNMPHEWTIFVRGPKADKDGMSMVKQVIFYLHPDFSPSEVTLKEPPFQITRVGYAPFEIEVGIVLEDGKVLREAWVLVFGTAGPVYKEFEAVDKGRKRRESTGKAPIVDIDTPEAEKKSKKKRGRPSKGSIKPSAPKPPLPPAAAMPAAEIEYYIDVLNPKYTVYSPHEQYTTVVDNETPAMVAEKFDVPAYDLLFLNTPANKGLTVNAKLKTGTMLRIPDKPKAVETARKLREAEWYIAEDDETPKMISTKTGIDTAKLISWNKGRIQGLVHGAKLEPGTRLRISPPEPGPEMDPYCHWTFPDSRLEDSEPSYMMVRRLKRRAKGDPKGRTETILVDKERPWEQYPGPEGDAVAAGDVGGLGADAPKHPKKAMTAFMYFTNSIREEIKQQVPEASFGEINKIMGQRWKALTVEDKVVYESADEVKADRERYEEAMVGYRAELAKHKALRKKPEPLFNKVVSVADRPGQLFFVLTYLPDLQWTHLAPLMEAGVFGPEKGQEAAGKKRWKLVPEGEAEEIDTSALQCTVVKTRAMKRTTDADKEEWLIVEETDEARRKARIASERAAERQAQKELGDVPGPGSGKAAEPKKESKPKADKKEKAPPRRGSVSGGSKDGGEKKKKDIGVGTWPCPNDCGKIFGSHAAMSGHKRYCKPNNHYLGPEETTKKRKDDHPEKKEPDEKEDSKKVHPFFGNKE